MPLHTPTVPRTTQSRTLREIVCGCLFSLDMILHSLPISGILPPEGQVMPQFWWFHVGWSQPQQTKAPLPCYSKGFSILYALFPWCSLWFLTKKRNKIFRMRWTAMSGGSTLFKRPRSFLPNCDKALWCQMSQPQTEKDSMFFVIRRNKNLSSILNMWGRQIDTRNKSLPLAMSFDISAIWSSSM